MALKPSELDELLRLTRRDAMQQRLDERTPTLPQAQQLAEHALALTPEPQALRLAIVHTYTSDLLEPWLGLAAALHGFALQTYHAPYGLALQEAAPGSALLQHGPDITLLMLRREDLHPDLALPITGLDSSRLAALRQECLARLADILGRFRAQPVGQIVLTLLPGTTAATLGLFDAQAEASEQGWWAALKADIAAWIRGHCAATLLLDLDQVQHQVGSAQFFDRRYWHSAQFPFTAMAAREFGRRLLALAVVMLAPKAKVIVLDADNTLWGGVVGEDGIDGIALGPDYPGSAYLEFQRRLLDFQQRGFILALCSKNNPADVDEVLHQHPHQLLRDGHFAARRVNWLAKPDNLESLAAELNLGLESFIFVDDSDHECAAVRHRLPQVQVVQVPSRPVDVARCLDHVARLEVLSLTREDLDKTALYAQERQRRALLLPATGSPAAPGDHLARLGMAMRISLAPKAHLARLSQLTKKTNQFNLTTRRYDEHQIEAFIGSADWLVADFALADVFGDSGVVGLCMLRLTAADTAEIDTLLMSCRVIGRQAESAFLQALLRLLTQRGVRQVLADYLPTAKNMLVKDLLTQQGFALRKDGRYARPLDQRPAEPESAFPIAVTLAAAPP